MFAARHMRAQEAGDGRIAPYEHGNRQDNGNAKP